MAKTALVLAKGEEGLQPVFGMPVVRRLVLLLRRAGIETVHILSNRESLFSTISDLIPAQAFHAVSDTADLERTVAQINISENEMVLVARADHVIDQKSLSAFVQAAGADVKSTAVHTLNSNSHLAEAIYLAGSDSSIPILRAIWSAAPSGEDLLKTAEQFPVNAGLPCTVGARPEEIRTAEKALTAALASATAHRDGFMARYADRHLSCIISQRLAHTSIRPNGVTLFNVAIGLTGAFLLSRGGYWSQLCGTLLFLLCVVLDGVDGELARLKLQETVFGHYLDIITDNIVHVAIFIGIGIGLYRETSSRVYLDLLWVLLGGFISCTFAVYKVSKDRTDARESKTVDSLTGLLANRDFAYLLVALAIVSRLNWFLIGTAFGSYLFAAILLGLHVRARRSSARR